MGTGSKKKSDAGERPEQERPEQETAGREKWRQWARKKLSASWGAVRANPKQTALTACAVFVLYGALAWALLASNFWIFIAALGVCALLIALFDGKGWTRWGRLYWLCRAIPTVAVVVGLPIGMWTVCHYTEGRPLTWAVVPVYLLLAGGAVWSTLTLQAFGEWKDAAAGKVFNGVFWLALIGGAAGVTLIDKKPSAAEEGAVKAAGDIGAGTMSVGLIGLGSLGLLLFVATAVKDAAEARAGEEGRFKPWFTPSDDSSPSPAIRRLAARHRSIFDSRDSDTVTTGLTWVIAVILLGGWWLVAGIGLIGGDTSDRVTWAGWVLAGVPTVALFFALVSVWWSEWIAGNYPPDEKAPEPVED